MTRTLKACTLAIVLLVSAAASAQEFTVLTAPGGGPPSPYELRQRAVKLAVFRNDTTALREFVQEESSRRDAGEAGFPLVMMAAAMSKPDIVKTLVDAGADIDRRGFNRNSALMLVAMNRNEAMVRLLLDLGADRHAMNNEGKTALDLAKDAYRFYWFALPLLRAYSFSFTLPFRDSVQTRMMTILQ